MWVETGQKRQMPSQAVKGNKKTSNLAKVTLYRADVALQTVSMGREVEVLNFSL